MSQTPERNNLTQQDSKGGAKNRKIENCTTTDPETYITRNHRIGKGLDIKIL